MPGELGGGVRALCASTELALSIAALPGLDDVGPADAEPCTDNGSTPWGRQNPITQILRISLPTSISHDPPPVQTGDLGITEHGRAARPDSGQSKSALNFEHSDSSKPSDSGQISRFTQDAVEGPQSIAYALPAPGDQSKGQRLLANCAFSPGRAAAMAEGRDKARRIDVLARVVPQELLFDKSPGRHVSVPGFGAYRPIAAASTSLAREMNDLNRTRLLDEIVLDVAEHKVA